MKKERLRIENGSTMKDDDKAEKSVSAFKSLQFQLYEGEVAGIIFDSVIERKTFQKIITGNDKILAGKIYLNQVNLDLSSADKIFGRQVAFIDSKSILIDTLTVTDNIFLFADQRKILFHNTYPEIGHKLLLDLQLDINLLKATNKLTTEERVIVEIIKSYIENKQVVVLSGVAGFLKRNEVEEIYRLLGRLCERKMSFIIIESIEDIILQKIKRLYMIQHGSTVDIIDCEFVNKDKLYQSLSNIRKRVQNEFTSLNEIERETEAVMEWKNVSTSGLKNLSFSLERGEILKIFYLDDASCEQILGVFQGREKILSGKIILNNHIYNVGNIGHAMKKGVGFVEESPYKGMLFYDMSVRDNLNVALAQKSPWIWAKKKYIKSVNIQISEYLGKELASTRLRHLKPEILQRIAYFRWLLFHPKVLVILKPFVEADSHIKEVTLEMIEKLRESGISIVILTQNSSELNIFEGENVYIRNGKSIDEDEVYQVLYKEV